MFPTKKIVYIFVSIGDENAKISQDVKKKSFFENLKKIFSKNTKKDLQLLQKTKHP